MHFKFFYLHAWLIHLKSCLHILVDAHTSWKERSHQPHDNNWSDSSSSQKGCIWKFAKHMGRCQFFVEWKCFIVVVEPVLLAPNFPLFSAQFKNPSSFLQFLARSYILTKYVWFHLADSGCSEVALLSRTMPPLLGRPACCPPQPLEPYRDYRFINYRK